MRIGWISVCVVVAVAGAAMLRGGSGGIDGDFRFTSSGSISTLDPAAMSWIQELRLAGLLYEGLYVSDPASLRPVPGAAAGVDIDETRTRYVFHIRPDARWSNGEPVTAGDFVYAWRRAIEPGTAADYAFFFDDIAGVREYVAWRWSETTRIAGLPDVSRAAAVKRHLDEADRRFASAVGVHAEGEKTLRVELNRPVAYWLDLCSFAVMAPLHRGSLKTYRRVGESGLIHYDEQWAKPGRTVFNGPYVLSQWRFKRGLRLERNPHYWDRGRVHVESVAYVDVADPNTAWLMYSSGRLDFLPSIETSFAAALADNSGQRSAVSSQPGEKAEGRKSKNRDDIHLLPAFGTYYYNFNCRETLWDGRVNPFADARVRRAFVLATDRESLVQRVTRRGEPAAETLVPLEVIPGYPHVNGLPFDARRARQELEEAGFPEGRGFPEVHLLYSTDGSNGLVAESVAQMWREHLGVRTRLVGKEVQSFREDKKKQVYMVSSASWYGDYLDPTSFLDTLRSGNGNNDSDFRDEAYDARMAATDGAVDAGERLAMLASAETYMLNAASPVLPLYRYVHVAAFDPRRVRGLVLSPRLLFSLKDVRMYDLSK